LGHFSPIGWCPAREAGSSGWQARVAAFDDAVENSDLMAALAASAKAILQGAMEISRDLKASVGEVFMTWEGLARPPADVMGTLVHEAAHASAHWRGIKNTSRQGRYHNQRFKAIAEEFGLDVEPDPPFGWSQTTLPAATATAYTSALEALGPALRACRASVGSRRSPATTRRVAIASQPSRVSADAGSAAATRGLRPAPSSAARAAPAVRRCRPSATCRWRSRSTDSSPTRSDVSPVDAITAGDVSPAPNPGTTLDGTVQKLSVSGTGRCGSTTVRRARDRFARRLDRVLPRQKSRNRPPYAGLRGSSIASV
jgi:hypothetical protein